MKILGLEIMMEVMFVKDLSNGLFYQDGRKYEVTEAPDSCVVWKEWVIKDVVSGDTYHAQKIFKLRTEGGSLDMNKFYYQLIQGSERCLS